MGKIAAPLGLGLATGGMGAAAYYGVKALTPKKPNTQMPSMTDPGVQKAAADEAQRRRAAMGYRSTIMTNFMNDYQPGSMGTKGTLG